MKIPFIFLAVFCISGSLNAELRIVAISTTPIYKETKSNTKVLLGHKYSLHTGLKKEDLKDVGLEDLMEGIKKVSWSGSAVDVGFYSKTLVDSKTLVKILTAISENIHLDLIYLENGQSNGWGNHIKKQFQL